jgi:hypothetical protein
MQRRVRRMPGAPAAPVLRVPAAIPWKRLDWAGTMQGTDFDEVAFFRAVEGCGARAIRTVADACT